MFGGLVPSKLQLRSRKQAIHFQLVGFADRLQEMDHWAIDPQMEYLQEHLPMPTADPGFQWLVSKLRQPSSTSHRKWLARESLWIRSPPCTFSLPQKWHLGVKKHCDLHDSLVEEHSGLYWPCDAGSPVQHETRVIGWWLTFGIWVMVVLSHWLEITDLEAECG